MTSTPESVPGALTPEGQRRLAVDLFNHTWELLETADRTPAQDDRMVHAAHASRFHWEQVGDTTNLVAGEWQCSRVYAVLGRAEPSRWHARRALALCGDAEITGFFRAASYEALARASLVAGDLVAAAEAEAAAWAAAEAIDDPEDRHVFEQDMAKPASLGPSGRKAGSASSSPDNDHRPATESATDLQYWVVETGVDPVTPRFSGVCSAD